MTTNVLKAYVDESNCIGCGKCIRVCPTDAIVGAKRMLHTILPQLCTNCSNCVDVCPTDCITLSTPGLAMDSAQEQHLKEIKTARQAKAKSHRTSVEAATIFTPQPTQPVAIASVDQRKQTVADAIARMQAKKQAQQQKTS